MQPVVDQTTDLNGQVLYQLLQQFDPPNWVKSAEAEQIRGDELPSSAYAYPGRNMFPVHTPAATWVSTAFFLRNRDSMTAKEAELTEETLTNAASVYGIEDDIAALKQAWDDRYSADSLALADDDFALIEVNPNTGKRERHYPLRNAVEVVKAAQYLETNRAAFTYAQRNRMAGRITEKAAKHGANLGPHKEFIRKQAGYGGCVNQSVAELLFDRARLVRAAGGPKEIQLHVASTAKAALDRGDKAISEPQLVDLANTIDQLDRLYKIAYDETCLPAEDVLFELTPEKAAEVLNSHCKTATGSIYRTADLGRLKLSAVRDLLGDEVAEAVSAGGILVCPEKMAEHVPTLPRPDAALLDRLCAEVGVVPYAKEAAAAPKRMTTADWFRLAKARQGQAAG